MAEEEAAQQAEEETDTVLVPLPPEVNRNGLVSADPLQTAEEAVWKAEEEAETFLGPLPPDAVDELPDTIVHPCDPLQMAEEEAVWKAEEEAETFLGPLQPCGVDWLPDTSIHPCGSATDGGGGGGAKG